MRLPPTQLSSLCCVSIPPLSSAHEPQRPRTLPGDLFDPPHPRLVAGSVAAAWTGRLSDFLLEVLFNVCIVSLPLSSSSSSSSSLFFIIVSFFFYAFFLHLFLLFFFFLFFFFFFSLWRGLITKVFVAPLPLHVFYF